MCSAVPMPLPLQALTTGHASEQRRSMFTGLVEALGTVRQSEAVGAGRTLIISAPTLTQELNVGESVAINGFSAAIFPAPAAGPGGVFTQGSNIGSRARDSFCVIPELQLQAGVNLSSRLRAFVGYDFLYVSNVVRPGDQIDRTLNFTSNSAISGVSPPTLIGAPRPAPLFENSSFWAQGINIGIEFRF